MIVAVSDTHLGTERLHGIDPDRESLKAFLRYLRDDLRPDHLVLNGDVEDLWRRDMRTLTRESYDVFALLSTLRESRIAVHYVLGNHDWYARRDAAAREEPYYESEYVEEVVLESDGVNYAFRHGHGFDPVQREWYFDKLALVSTDAVGATFSEKWAIYADAEGPSDLVTSVGKLLYDRITAGSWDDRVLEMDRCETEINLGVRPPGSGRFVRRRDDVDWLCIGHTHEAGVAADANVANAGAWLGKNHTYLVLEAEPRLMVWTDGEAVPLDES